MKKINWIHLSDLHTKSSEKAFEKYNRDIVVAALLEDLQERKKNQYEKIDFLFFTGDLAFSGNSGRSSEYSEAFKSFLEPVIHILNIGKENVFLVPGNHDADRSYITKEAKSISKKLKNRDEINRLFLDSSDKIKLINERFKSYDDFIKNNFPHLIPNEFPTLFKCNRLISDCKVQIVGINSALISTGGDSDKNKLIIGECVTRSSYKNNPDFDLNILLLHHPPSDSSLWYCECENNNLDTLIEKFDFVLCGHVHDTKLIQTKTKFGESIKFTCGSLFDSREWRSNCYNFVDIDLSQNRGSAFYRRYEDKARPKEKFLPDYLLDSSAESPGRVDFDIKIGITSDIVFAEKSKITIAQLIDIQNSKLRNRPLLCGEFSSVDSIGTLFPEGFIDGSIRRTKTKEKELIPFINWCNNNFSTTKKTIIIGNPGAGKSTMLFYIFDKLLRKNKAGSSDLLPVFSEARFIKFNKSITKTDILNTAFSLAGVRPLLQVNENLLGKIFPLIDGVDEAFLTTFSHDKQNVNSIFNCNFPHILVCRKKYFETFLRDTDFCSNYDEIIEVEPWSCESEVKEYVDNYLDKVAIEINPKLIKSEVKSIITDICSKGGFEITPLAVTALFFILLNKAKNEDIKKISSLASLLNKFFKLWIERESSNSQIFKDNVKTLDLLFHDIAEGIFYTKFQKYDLIRNVVESFCNKNGINHTQLIQDRAFTSLIRTEKDEYAESYEYVFKHEALYELLIARKVLLSFVNYSDCPLIENYLGREINTFVRELVSSRNTRKITLIINWFKDNYASVQSGDFSSSRNTLKLLPGSMKLLNVMYFWGRFEECTKTCTIADVFRRILDKEIMEHPVISNTIGSGILHLNQKELSRRYLESIDCDGELDAANRNYHKVYYGDKDFFDLSSLINDSNQKAKDDWKKTRRAILSRFSSFTDRALTMRGLDLVTFKRLFQCSCSIPLTEEDVNTISKCLEFENISAEIDLDFLKPLLDQLVILIKPKKK